MEHISIPAALLFYYGLFLILCGISAFIFIGKRAKTALISGSVSGVAAMTAGHFIHHQSPWAPAAGIVLTTALFCVFAWRSTKTLFRLLEITPAHEELKGKAVAFLIISLMAVTSLFATFIQLLHL